MGRMLDDLDLFLCVAAHGSVNKAAKQLRLPKSTVSRRLASLEDFFRHAGESRDWPYTAAWIDCLAKGSDTGRGFFTLAGESAVATTTIRISAGGGASAEIEEIWVQPSARGRGIGSRLLRSAVAECQRRGIQSIELRVTPDDHEVGIPDFYLKQGFRDRGRQIMEFAGE